MKLHVLIVVLMIMINVSFQFYLNHYQSRRLHISSLQLTNNNNDDDNYIISILAEISHESGSLHNVLSCFLKYDLSITHIESRPSQKDEDFIIYIDFINNTNSNNVINELKMNKVCKNVLLIDPIECNWYPKHISDLDKVANRVIHGGTDLESDHPGFHDVLYKERRSELANIAMNYKYGDEIPIIKYTNDEINTWKVTFEKLDEMHRLYASREYNQIVSQMKSQIGYSSTTIPQLRYINNYLKSTSKFQIRPVAGLLSPRDFLNGLAHRTFFSTPYIRHYSKPLYTPGF